MIPVNVNVNSNVNDCRPLFSQVLHWSLLLGLARVGNICICSAIVRVIMPTTGTASECWKIHETRASFSLFSTAFIIRLPFGWLPSITGKQMEVWKIFDTWSFKGELIETKLHSCQLPMDAKFISKPPRRQPLSFALWHLKSWSEIYGISCYILWQLMPEYKTQAHKLQFN